MKAKKGYSALESFSLSFSAGKSGVLELPGNAGRTRLINDLFDSGDEGEARRVLRQALDEIARDLARPVAEEKRGKRLGDAWEGTVIPRLPEGVEI